MDATCQYVWWLSHCAAPHGLSTSRLGNKTDTPGRVAQSSHTAAQAFRSLCNRCSAKLRRPATLLSLIEAAEAVLAPSAQPSAGGQSVSPATALTSKDRVVIVEGLARIVAVLPPADAAAAGLRLSTPFTQRVQQLATATAGTPTVHSGQPCHQNAFWYAWQVKSSSAALVAVSAPLAHVTLREHVCPPQ